MVPDQQRRTCACGGKATGPSSPPLDDVSPCVFSLVSAVVAALASGCVSPLYVWAPKWAPVILLILHTLSVEGYAGCYEVLASWFQASSAWALCPVGPVLRSMPHPEAAVLASHWPPDPLASTCVHQNITILSE